MIKLLFAILVSIGTQAHADLVRLNAPLSESGSPSINNTPYITVDAFEDLFRNSLHDIFLTGKSVIQVFGQELAVERGRSLSDETVKTIFLTQLRLMGEFDKRIVATEYCKANQKILRDFALNWWPETARGYQLAQVTKAAIKEIGKGADTIYSNRGPEFSDRIENLIWTRALLDRLESKLAEKPELTELLVPIISATDDLIRKQLIYYDLGIKKIANSEPEVANRLAQEVVEVLLAADISTGTRKLERNFQGLPQGFTLDVMAKRNLTRAIDLLHKNVLTPVRKLIFTSTVVTFALAAGLDVFGFSEGAAKLNDIRNLGFTTWLYMAFENLTVRYVATYIANLLDKVINRINAIYDQRRDGPLAKQIEFISFACRNIF